MEGESGLTNLLYYSLQGINSTGGKKWMRAKYRAIKSKTEQDVIKHS